MAQLDIGKAAFAGFGVIGRKPLPPIIWGLVTMLLSVGPMLLILPALLQFFDLAVAGVQNNTDPDPEQIMMLSAQMNTVTPLTWIAALLAYGLTTGALFRAMLKPEEKSWFYMRVSMAEVMLVVVTIVYAVLLLMAAGLLAGLVAVLALIAHQISESATLPVAIVLGLAALGVLVWGGLRFSLGLAMSWERKSFLLFESWSLTRGHAFGLFLVGLINFIISLLLAIVVGVVVGGSILAVMASTGMFQALASEDPGAFFTPEKIKSLWPIAVVWITLASIFQSYLTVVQTAPWAEAYGQLGTSNEETF
ncbi:hypothetical protein [Caulobacter sp. NIBR1757]|uniref:hypothetical protein n=1 Tax=Caulobacter sp. NIBR1757 TaxID=3016000 RepID=UPI0022F0083D|nr:hypothetical protein [Caulobacter sp. NIBR1757]WGM39876.1 hypothetical protein AMEJIAPC_02816 [Caulobacter sp. NIBR1757]